MIASIQRALFQTKERWAHPNLERILAEMRTNDDLSRGEFNELRRGLLRNSLRMAADCPYYREEFRRHSLDPALPETLQNLPPLKRTTTQERRKEFLHPSARVEDLTAKTTSGSTGTQASFFRSRDGMEWGYATGERSKDYWELDRTARFARVWGRSFRYKKRLIDRLRGRASLVKDRAVGVFNIDASGLSLEFLERLWPTLERWQPRRLHGYGAGIYLIAKHVNEGGLRGVSLDLDSVILESEQCFEFQKEAMRRAFGCPVLEWYGCVEVGVIATPCQKGNMHVREDHVHLETLDDQVLLTTLREPAMPLIRYELGDEGVISAEQCPCGLPSRIFEELRGRTPDQLRRVDGSYFPGHMLTHVFDQFTHLRRFQLVQKAEDHVHVLLETRESLSDEDRTRLISKLKKMFGGPVQVRLEECAAIPAQESGKFRWVLNELPQAPARGAGE